MSWASDPFVLAGLGAAAFGTGILSKPALRRIGRWLDDFDMRHPPKLDLRGPPSWYTAALLGLQAVDLLLVLAILRLLA